MSQPIAIEIMGLFLSLILTFGMIDLPADGIVITHTDSLKGEVQVHLSQNRITLKANNSYTNFHAREISKVSTSNGEIYYTAPFGIGEGYYLFETISDGSVPLLYREGIKMMEFEESVYPPFFIYQNGSVYPLSGKKQVLQIFENVAAVKSYLKSSKPNFDDLDDLKLLFEFCNAL